MDTTRQRDEPVFVFDKTIKFFLALSTEKIALLFFPKNHSCYAVNDFYLVRLHCFNNVWVPTILCTWHLPADMPIYSVGYFCGNVQMLNL